MGRHSVSYIAAQQRRATGSTPPSAATYVGRIGALAFALGVGAAVAGGAGIAHADGTTDKDPAGAEASPNPTAGEDAEKGADTATKPRKPRLLDIPKMVLGGGVLRPGAADADSGPSDLARVLSKLQRSSLVQQGNDQQDSAVRPAAKGNDRPGRHTRDDVESFVRTSVDDATQALRSVGQSFSAPSRPVDTQPAPNPADPPAAKVTSGPVAGLSALTQIAPTPTPTVAPRIVHPVVTAVSGVLRALGFSPSSAVTGNGPTAPTPVVIGALQLISRDIERTLAQQRAQLIAVSTSQQAVTPNPAVPPAPGDQVETDYGNVGKWMLESDGSISDWGGDPYEGKQIIEPVNVIIVDEKSKTPEEAALRLNKAMFFAGFPAQPIHSTGFQGSIDGIKYGQQPGLPLLAYSDNLFIFPNNHGRIFGPDPVESPSGGYVWSGAFSTEELAIVDGLPGHTYVSSNTARTALAMRLILTGQATYVGMQKMDNAYNTDGTTTGDHDGYAIVLKLR